MANVRTLFIASPAPPPQIRNCVRAKCEVLAIIRRTAMAAMLLCCTIVARAQSITGRVLDQQGNAIEFVNVVLLSKADSTALAGTITDSTGAFSLQSSAAMANTCLRLSFVGYKP